MTPEVRLWCKLDTSRVQVKPDCLVIWLASQPPVTPSPAFWSTGLLSKAANSFFESSALSLALFFQVLLWPVPDDFCPVVFAALVLLPRGCWCAKFAFDGRFLANAWWCLVRLTRENANKSGVNGASLFARLTLTDSEFWVRHMVDLRWCCVKPRLSSNFLLHLVHTNMRLDVVNWDYHFAFAQFCGQTMSLSWAIAHLFTFELSN